MEFYGDRSDRPDPLMRRVEHFLFCAFNVDLQQIDPFEVVLGHEFGDREAGDRLDRRRRICQLPGLERPGTLVIRIVNRKGSGMTPQGSMDRCELGTARHSARRSKLDFSGSTAMIRALGYFDANEIEATPEFAPASMIAAGWFTGKSYPSPPRTWRKVFMSDVPDRNQIG